MSPRGAVHNALARGQLSSALSRAVGDDVGASGLERYGETLTPIVDLWRQPEWAYLRRETLLGTSGTVAAVAAEYSGLAIVNPDASGLIVVVDGAGANDPNAATLFHLGRYPTNLVLATYATLARGIALDTRWNIGQGAAATAGASLVASGTDPVQFFASAISADINVLGLFCQFPDAFPLILHPGQSAVLECGAVNTTVRFRARWRERKAFPGELE